MNILGLLTRDNHRYFGFSDEDDQGETSDNLIRPDIVISEKHIDSANITSHPVEDGATISDHVFDNSAELRVEMIFGSGGSLIDFFDTSESLDLNLGKSASEMYQEILNLKAQKEPLIVSTGKRLYKDMLIKTITVETDQKSEYILSIIIDFIQITITTPHKANVIPVTSQKFNNQTMGITNVGGVQTVDSTNDELKTVTGL